LPESRWDEMRPALAGLEKENGEDARGTFTV